MMADDQEEDKHFLLSSASDDDAYGALYHSAEQTSLSSFTSSSLSASSSTAHQQQRPRYHALFKPVWYLVFLSLFAFGQSMVISGVFPVSVTSITRQLGYTNAKVGILPALYDAGVAVGAVFVTHLGHRAHKPRWCAYAALVFGVGALVMAIPGMVYREAASSDRSSAENGGSAPLALSNTSQLLCSLEPRQDACESEEVDYSLGGLFFFILVVGELLMALGASPIYNIGVSFMDDNVDPDKTSIYMAIMYTCTAVGPAVGFLLGGVFLSIYVTLHAAPEGVDAGSSSWIGAWWLGMLVASVACFVASPFLFMFPASLPGTEWIRQLRSASDTSDTRPADDSEVDGPGSHSVTTAAESEVDDLNPVSGRHTNNDISSSSTVESIDIQPLSSLPASDRRGHGVISVLVTTFQEIKVMLKNETFTGVSIGNMMDIFIVSGVGTFLPAFVETQFHVTASDASFYTGVAIILAVTTGTMAGGAVVRWRNWSARQTSLALMCFSLANLAGMLMFLVSCDTLRLAGLNAPYFPFAPTESPATTMVISTTTTTSSSTATPFMPMDGPIWEGCDPACHCSLRDYRAVCHHPSDTTLFNPCAAGCSVHVGVIDGVNAFGNCTCVPNTTDPMAASHGVYNLVTSGKCQGDCHSLLLFLCLLFFGMFWLFMNAVPVTQVHLRCVEEKQRSFALGLAQAIARLIGAVPAPIVVGALLDDACVLWEERCDGTRGACLQYTNAKMARKLGLTTAIVKLIAVLAYYWAWRKFPKHRDKTFQTQKGQVIELDNLEHE
eukprot:m.46891 g.46891  ORF g.46891 m.46891 type:complete len:781 (-) comp12285_c0_seq1:414-2756(-)